MQDQTSAFSLDRRRFLTTTAGVVGALAGMNLLQACGASGGSSGSNTLSFLGHETADQVKDLITGFEAAHQGVSVQYQPVPFDQINDVLQTRLGSRDVTPDVYTADQPRMAALHHRNFLADITGKVGSDKNAVLPASLQASSLDGKIYSLPMATSTQLLYYNTALLEKAGVTPPETDQDKRWTWEQLVAAAQKAQAGGAKWGFIFEQVSRYYQLQSLFESAGAGSGLTGQGLLTPAITSPGWIKTATFYGQLFSSGLAPKGVSPDQTTSLFTDGKVAFYLGGPWQLQPFSQAKGLSFGVAPHPYFAGGKPVTPTSSWALAINPNSQKQDLAYQFIQYATLTTKGSEQSNSSGGMPANIQALDSYFAADYFQKKNLIGAADLIKYEAQNTAVIRPPTIGYIQFEDIMGAAFEDIRNGANVEQRLQKASGDLKTAFARL